MGMTVNIGDHFEKLIGELISGGRFQNQSEVIRAGLRLLEDREYAHDEALEAELLARTESPSAPWTKADFAKIRKLGRIKSKASRLKRAA
jgi:antitoxin ParD1/3/4